MTAPVISIDRRQHPREGLMGQLEDITYAVVRRYSVIGEVGGDQTDPSTFPLVIQ